MAFPPPTVFLRAKTVAYTVPLQTGVVATVSTFFLKTPVTYAKSSGDANLSINTSTGAVSAASALTAGASQSLVGTATGADGVVVPFTATLTGQISVPAAPTVTLTPGDGQVSIAWVDNSNGGAAITAHRIYVNGAGMSPITSASPYVLTGLPNGTAVAIEVAAINSVGEGAKSASQSSTPAAAVLRTATGTFTGTGSKQEIALPFVPDFVIVWAADQPPYWKNRTTWHGRSQRLDNQSSEYIVGPGTDQGMWMPFSAAKFSVDASYSVSGKTYRYAAVKTNGGNAMEEVSIVGNALNGRMLDFTSRRSALTMNKRDSSKASVWQTDGAAAAAAGTTSESPRAGSVVIRDAGVTLSNDNWVNENSNTALGEGIEYFSFINGGGVKVERITGTGSGSRILTGHGKVAFVLDATRSAGGGAVVPQIVIDGLNGDGFDGTAPANAVSLAAGSLNLPAAYNAAGVEYIIMSMGDAGATPVAATVTEPTATAKSGRTFGVAQLSTGVSVSGPTSWEYYGKPGGQMWNEFLPLLMFGDGAEQGVAGTMNGGIYLYRTDPDGHNWRGAVIRVIHSNYLARDRTGANNSINYYNFNTGIVVRPGEAIHIVVTHDGSGHWRVWVNGKLAKDYNVNLNQATYGNRANGGGGASLPVYVNSANLAGTTTGRIGEIYRVRQWNTELTAKDAASAFVASRDNSAWGGPAPAQEWDFRTSLPSIVSGITLADKFVGRRNLPWFTNGTAADATLSASGDGILVTTTAVTGNGRALLQLVARATYRLRTAITYNQATRIIGRLAVDSTGQSAGATTIFDVTGAGVLDRTDTFTVASGVEWLALLGITSTGQSFIINAETDLVRLS